MGSRPQSKFAALYISTLFLAMFVSYQNCSPATFSGEQASKVTDSGLVPTDTNTSTSTGPVLIEAKFCLEDSGTKRAEAETWTIVTDTQEMVPCPEGPAQTRVIRTTKEFLCKDGQILLSKSGTTDQTPAPACPMPMLVASVTPAAVPEGTTAQLKIESRHVASVKYSCKNLNTGSVFKAGSVNPGSSQVPLLVQTDLQCEIEAQNSLGVKVIAKVDVPLDCGSKLNDGGRCVEFSCKSIVAISEVNGLITVPARTTSGTCYSIKLLNAIQASNSWMSPSLDTMVTSRNHDHTYDDPTQVRNPYLMGSRVVHFNLLSARKVKLSGAGQSLSPITVDNFVLVGLYPKSTLNPGSQFYHAYGTSDSSVNNTGTVLVNGQPISFEAFASGGVSTITPLDITNEVKANQQYTLDVRAEDCGAIRSMSDLYLLFQ